MKSLTRNFSNVIWLCKPYWKHGRLYMILSVFFLAIAVPFDDLLYVVVPGVIINMLADGANLAQAAVVVAIIAFLGFLRPTLPNIFYVYFRRKRTQIDLIIKQEVYDYQVFGLFSKRGHPYFFNRYVWSDYTRGANNSNDPARLYQLLSKQSRH